MMSVMQEDDRSLLRSVNGGLRRVLRVQVLLLM